VTSEHWGWGASLKPIIHNGQVMTLDHLAPFTFNCPCPDINRDLSIRAQFVNQHCYTKRYDPAIHDPKEIIVAEAKDRHRVFCPMRYELSRRLPKLIPELPNKQVHQTSQSRNYVYVVPLEIAGDHYEIYFMLQRAAPDDAADLRLTVESAYRSEGPPNLRKRPNAIRFVVLAHKMFMNRPVRFAPR
jgi:hypothetical protein